MEYCDIVVEQVRVCNRLEIVINIQIPNCSTRNQLILIHGHGSDVKIYSICTITRLTQPLISHFLYQNLVNRYVGTIFTQHPEPLFHLQQAATQL
jgi:hypothetical protein